MSKADSNKVTKHHGKESMKMNQFPFRGDLGEWHPDGIEILEPPFPDYFRKTLENLYENVFCTADMYVKAHGCADISAYVAYFKGGISCILLFTRTKNAVTVLNEIFSLAIDEMERFARFIFATLSARTIQFSSVSLSRGPINLLHQRFNSTEDIVIALPDSTQEYKSLLGKNMRSSITRFQRRITSEFPKMVFEFFAGHEVSASIIDEVIALSKARIESKQQIATHTLDSVKKLQNSVRNYGVVVLASMDGRVCGGVICTNVAGNFFMHVIAHDPTFDKYRLGKICCYMSICDAINRGAREYHLLCGRYEYKYRFLGLQRDFERVIIYRSYASLAIKIRLYSQTAFRGYGRRVKYLFKNYSGRFVETSAQLRSLFS